MFKNKNQLRYNLNKNLKILEKKKIHNMIKLEIILLLKLKNEKIKKNYF